MKCKKACNLSPVNKAYREVKRALIIKDSSGRCVRVNKATGEETKALKRDHVIFYDWQPLENDEV